ncbi:MAG: hypothetical protein GYB67_12335 [Chloroflexi bacterium]|nr:hypothetical protein [Chloroflexota bacterium]
MRNRLTLGSLAGLLLIASCSALQPPTPTPFPTNTPVPVTPSATFTPLPTPTPITPIVLPPTWTPIFVPSPTLTPEFVSLERSGRPTLAACANFGEDLNQNSFIFQFGTQPRVYWTPMSGAVLYQITLYDPELEILVRDVIDIESGQNYAFDADLFELDQIYRWEVVPLNGDRFQLCEPLIVLLRVL